MKDPTLLPRITKLSWDIVEGCSPVSTGCKNCYAKTVLGDKFSTITLFPERLSDPDKWASHDIAFVCENTDIFHPDVPTSFIKQVFDVIVRHPTNTFVFLTKRPGRLLLDSLQMPRNTWFGISAEDQETLDRRAPYLIGVNSKVKFISAQPLLAPLDLTNHELDWLLVGSEYGQNARAMDEAWVIDLYAQVELRGIPMLYQQKLDASGVRILLPTINGKRINEYPRSLWG